MHPYPGLVFGGGAFLEVNGFGGIDEVKQALSYLQEEGINIIDTAANYGNSEETLGELSAAKSFLIGTKYPGEFCPKPTTKKTVRAIAEASLKKLQTDQVDVYYLHSLDRRASVETQIEAVNELHKAGKVKRFGVSNFLAAEVEESVRIAKEKGWIAPSVYQGNYSAIARRQEQELFPVLRKHSIEFYAYSPIAGGFLSKSVDVLVNGGRGRWDPSTFMGKLYHALYNTPSMLAALKKWETLSEQSGIPKAELAYRWVVHNSALQAEYGDKVIIGPRNKQQLKETVAAVKKGPLPAEVTEKIEEIWTLVAADAPLDNFHDGVLKMSTEEVEEAKKRFLPTASKD